MKAIVSNKFCPPNVLEYTDIEKPEPKEDEILVKNYATSIIDTVYPLDKTSEAHHNYETGHSKGRVMISIGQEPKTEEVLS